MNNSKDIVEAFFYKAFEKSINEKILDNIDYVIPESQIINYIEKLLSIPYQEYLDYLISWDFPKIETGDLTQSSSFQASEIEMCEALLSYDNLGFTFEEIGQMFPQYCKKHTKNAFKKYGENQVKTSKQLGLTFQYYGKWFLNCLGYVYPKLTLSQRKSLLARTILRDKLYGSIIKDLIFNDISLESYMIGLSSSTIARRISGILRILQFAYDESELHGYTLCKCLIPSKSSSKRKESFDDKSNDIKNEDKTSSSDLQNQEHSDNEIKTRKKSSRTNIIIIFPDGFTIKDGLAKTRFVEAIKYMGIDKVKNLNEKVCGVPLIDDHKDDKYGNTQVPVGEYYIITHSSTDGKKKRILEIAKKLGIKPMIVKTTNEVSKVEPEQNNQKDKSYSDISSQQDNNILDDANEKKRKDSTKIYHRSEKLSNIIYLRLKSNALSALAKYENNVFTVLKGSEATAINGASVNPEIRNRQLSENAHKEGDIWILDNDVTFKSPSAAAVFCLGRSSNGKIEWVDDKNNTLKKIIEMTPKDNNQTCLFNKDGNDYSNIIKGNLTSSGNSTVVVSNDNQRESLFLFTKKVDKSFLTRGFTLAKTCHDQLINVIGKDILKGDKELVKVNLLGTLYQANLNHIGFTESNRECYQIYWKNLNDIKPVLKKFNINDQITVYGIKNGSEFIIKIKEPEIDNNTKQSNQFIPLSKENNLNKENNNIFLKTKNGYFKSRFHLNSPVLRTIAYYNGKKITVIKGSEVQYSYFATYSNPQKRDKVLKKNAYIEAGKWILNQGIRFDSPSAASSFCLGKKSDGLIDWVDENNNPLKVYYEKANIVVGIWDAFKSSKFRKLFESQIFKQDISIEELRKYMHLFENKILEVDNDVTFNVELKDSKSFDEISKILSRIFEIWANKPNYIFYKAIFKRYLMLLKEYHNKNGNLIEPL